MSEMIEIFQFKDRRVSEHMEKTITRSEFDTYIISTGGFVSKGFKTFINDTRDYNEFIVYSNIGILSGRAGIKTPDEKFNIVMLMS
jgi:uncharacterized protein YaaQ